MRPALSAALLWACAACVHPALTRGAPVVPVTGTRPPGCIGLGQVRGLALGSLAFGDTLIDYARNDLRNQAADLGATHVTELPASASAHACQLRGEALRCIAAARGTLAPLSLPPIPGALPAAAPPTTPTTPQTPQTRGRGTAPDAPAGPAAPLAPAWRRTAP